MVVHACHPAVRQHTEADLCEFEASLVYNYRIVKAVRQKKKTKLVLKNKEKQKKKRKGRKEERLKKKEENSLQTSNTPILQKNFLS